MASEIRILSTTITAMAAPGYIRGTDGMVGTEMAENQQTDGI